MCTHACYWTVSDEAETLATAGDEVTLFCMADETKDVTPGNEFLMCRHTPNTLVDINSGGECVQVGAAPLSSHRWTDGVFVWIVRSSHSVDLKQPLR